MTPLVVDASVTAAWCFDDEETVYARGILRQAEGLGFFVPAVWPVEMVNVLLVNERRNRISQAEIARATALFAELGIQVDRPATMQPFDATMQIARTWRLSSYDASYLELALRKGMPLATLDVRLQNAAKGAGAAIFG